MFGIKGLLLGCKFLIKEKVNEIVDGVSKELCHLLCLIKLMRA